MPSNVFGTFKYNLVDVERLLELHGVLRGTAPGKKGLGHITRSGVVMLCAAWEMYVEQVLIEEVQYLVQQVTSPEQLPKAIQGKLSSYVRGHKHELKPFHLAGDGWRTVLLDHATAKTDALNTPKSGNLNELFNSFLGIPELSLSWSNGADFVDGFVGVRGDIAHKGRDVAYVKVGNLHQYKDGMYRTACETDNATTDHIKAVNPINRKPWNSVA